MAEIVAMEGTWQEKRLHYGLNEQIFGADEQVRRRWFERLRSEKALPAPMHSFAEFEMLMGLDDGVLKRYGLPKPMVERALIECIKPSCSISRDTGITLDGGAAAPWPSTGWGLFDPNIQIIANSMGFLATLHFFEPPPKCEVAHTSSRLAPLKSGMATSIWRQEGTHGTETKTKTTYS